MADNNGDIDLSLGLSLNGRFGINPKRCNIKVSPNLPPSRRGNINVLMSPSSSVANLDMMGDGEKEIKRTNIILPRNLPPRRGNINALMSQFSSMPNLEMMGGGGKEIKEGSSSDAELAKTCSLPVDVKRKRKVLLTMKRMEAKKKTWGKLISGNDLRREMEIPLGENEGGDFPFAYLQELRRCGFVGSGGFSEIFNPFQIPGTSTASAQSLHPRVYEKAIQTSKSGGGVEISKAAQKAKAIKTSKSGGGVENSKAAQKAKAIKTSKSGGGVENSKAAQKARDGVENTESAREAGGGVENTESAQEESKTDQIPSVITTGPDRNTVKGFLYKYKKGEQVKIVSSCHGKFLSPTGFVKHYWYPR